MALPASILAKGGSFFRINARAIFDHKHSLWFLYEKDLSHQAVGEVLLRCFGAVLQQHALEDEQEGPHIHQRADLLLTGLAGEEIEQSPGDNADGDTSEML